MNPPCRAGRGHSTRPPISSERSRLAATWSKLRTVRTGTRVMATTSRTDVGSPQQEPMHRLLWLTCGVLGNLAVAACALGQPAVPTPEVFTALYVVRDGPYPLYADDGDWLPTRAAGLLATDARRQTIDAARSARAQQRVRTDYAT